MGGLSVIAICRWWVEESRVGMGGWLLARSCRCCWRWKRWWDLWEIGSLNSGRKWRAEEVKNHWMKWMKEQDMGRSSWNAGTTLVTSLQIFISSMFKQIGIILRYALPDVEALTSLQDESGGGNGRCCGWKKRGWVVGEVGSLNSGRN